IAQRQELEHSRKALELQADELRKSVEQFSEQTELHKEQLGADRSARIAQSIRSDLAFLLRDAVDFADELRVTYRIKPPHHEARQLLMALDAAFEIKTIIGRPDLVKEYLSSGKLSEAIAEVRKSVGAHAALFADDRLSVGITSSCKSCLTHLFEDLKRATRRTSDTYDAAFWSELRAFRLDDILNDLALMIRRRQSDFDVRDDIDIG
ncbi:MAG: hypothetical protein ABL907_04685, partial [Hyphomicrobium sp.]